MRMNACDARFFVFFCAEGECGGVAGAWCALRVSGLAERPADNFREGPFFAQDEAPGLRHGEVFDRCGIGAQPRAIRFVSGEAVERNQAPRDVVRPFVRQEIAEQMAAAARNDVSPVLGVLPERVALERIDLIADETGDCHGDSRRGCRGMADGQYPRRVARDVSGWVEVSMCLALRLASRLRLAANRGRCAGRAQQRA
ncbi:hypothetical protein BCAR13_420124 [Paraburkholderia caribensis]|nr:hypothetical protein BCAR13_420124 [Paraburkholderia caribensis]